MPPEKSKATIYDVAARAGVAISTVSRVLNNSSDVSEPTRMRVIRAINDLNFRPDRTARTLAQKQSKSICVALPSFTTPFHNELLKGVRTHLRQHQDIDLLLCDLGSENPRQTLLRFLKRGTVDGLLLAGMPISDELAAELTALYAPVVLVGHHWPTFDSFTWDDSYGAHLAMEHLIGLGHSSIACIKAWSESPLMSRRLIGYQSALQEAGLPFNPDLIRSGSEEKHAGFSEEAGYQAMRELLESGIEFSAVFTSSDVQAFGAIMALREAGKRIPEDISLVGYDGVKMARFVGLTTIDQRIHEVGARAMEVLLNRLNEGSSPSPRVHEVITPTLALSRSTQQK